MNISFDIFFLLFFFIFNNWLFSFLRCKRGIFICNWILIGRPITIFWDGFFLNSFFFRTFYIKTSQIVKTIERKERNNSIKRLIKKRIDRFCQMNQGGRWSNLVKSERFKINTMKRSTCCPVGRSGAECDNVIDNYNSEEKHSANHDLFKKYLPFFFLLLVIFICPFELFFSPFSIFIGEICAHIRIR